MDLQQSILLEEAEFQKLLTNYEERDFGILFYNEKEPESDDSNHAILYPEKTNDFEAVLCEIKTFYLGKGLTPRIYQPFVTGYFTERSDVLKRNGFDISIFKNEFFLLSAKNTINIPSRLTIRRVTEWDERIATDIYIPAGEAYGVEPEKCNIKHENYYLFVGYIGEEMAAVVSFHTSALGLTRFDSILTPPKYRGKGYGKEILSYAVEFCMENCFLNCVTWFANPRSAKNGYEAGFRSLFDVETGVAVYKNTAITYRKASIHDIHVITELGLLLYSDDNTYESLYMENQSHLTNPDGLTILAFDGETTVGILQGSIRHDYVEGTESGDANSKVGYLEGIFVMPEYQHRYIAKALVTECEKWAKSMGCNEFASDCKLENEDSYRFHLKIGFSEVSRNIHFAKKL